MGRDARIKSLRRQARQQQDHVEEQLGLALSDALLELREEVHEFVVASGLKVVQAMLERDRVRLCGPKHARQPGREVMRAGTVPGEVVLGGRRVAVQRPRVRRVAGGEVRLPTYEWARREDPLGKRAVEQMVVGVATRKYARSLEPLPEEFEARGTSRSAVSRRFVARTQAELDAWLEQPLGEVDLVALLLDGIEFGEHTLVVAMGIDSTGQKHPLAIREGSTENATLCRELLRSLVGRGLAADRSLLVVIDGGKGLHSAVRQVFGEWALIQRCQVHKMRNVLDQLPESRRPFVRAAIRRAYAMDDADKAEKTLQRLATSLDEAYPSAAASLREGLKETLTIVDLGLGPTLRRSLSTTNAIESMFATVRIVTGRVTRWRGGRMVQRWGLAGIREAEKKFRRLMGKADMPRLVTALRERDRERAGKRAAAAA